MFARNNKVKQITEAVQFESDRSNGGQFGVGFYLPLIEFPNPNKGWTFSSKLGEDKVHKKACKLDEDMVYKKVYKIGDTICEETIKSEVVYRRVEDFVDACHAGSCEFNSRPPRGTGV